MEIIRNKKGLTIIEIVISFAIFSILIVVFLNVFLESLVITSRSGARSDSVAYVSSEIEKKLAYNEYPDNANLSVSTTPKAIIKYNPGTGQQKTENMNGQLVTATELNEKGQSIEVKVFIPEVTP